jgi:hypothetical protein
MKREVSGRGASLPVSHSLDPLCGVPTYSLGFDQTNGISPRVAHDWLVARYLTQRGKVSPRLPWLEP